MMITASLKDSTKTIEERIQNGVLTRMSFILNTKKQKKLKNIALKKDVSMNDIIISLIDDFIEKH